jgi:tripartite-type tricarboxylate transporter receptor subunit TctC
MRTRLLICFVLGLLAASTSFAQAAFPSRQVHMVVPFPPGGASDALMRILAAKLQENWKQPVVVENKPGAGTVIGSNAVAKAAPDGYTVGLVTSSHAINAAARRELPYDTLKDFALVSQLAVVHQAILARSDFPVNDMRELVAAAKAKRMTYATAGVGTAGHLFGELLNTIAGTSLVHVAYKGSSPAQVDLLAGNVDIIVDALSAHQEMVKAGRLKVIALVTPQRNPDLPQLATAAETYPGASVESFFGIVAPAGTPRPVVEQLSRDIAAALQDSQVRRRMAGLGLLPLGTSPAQFESMVRGEIRKWSDLIKKANLRLD